jgi:hypothetical protein
MSNWARILHEIGNSAILSMALLVMKSQIKAPTTLHSVKVDGVVDRPVYQSRILSSGRQSWNVKKMCNRVVPAG